MELDTCQRLCCPNFGNIETKWIFANGFENISESILIEQRYEKIFKGRIEASHIRKAKSETVNLLPHVDFVIPKQPCLMFSINFPKVCIFGMFQSKIVIVYCIFSLQFWDLVWFEIGIVSYFQRVLNLAD